ncbi:MAG: c-type cytochrome [Verrucomicrobiales bacterium]
MKYFFLIYALAIICVVGIGGFRGDKFSQPPVEVFPDMDTQDKLKGQKPDAFFEDGMGARQPVAGTVPNRGDNGVLPVEFGEGRTGYYYTGQFEGTYGNGMPEELELKDEASARAFLARGEEMFAVHCAPCHGESGDGKGVIAQYQGMASIVADLKIFTQNKYPDGHLYNVITNGKGNMGSYKHNLPVRDRWAIVAYVRTLQNLSK